MKKKTALSLFLSIIFLLSSLQGAAAAPSFQKIGPQVKNLNVSTAVPGTNSKGEPLMFSLLQGMPAVLAVTNLDTGKVVDTKQLSGATAGWSISATDPANIWIGTTPGELLFHYDPNTKKLSKMGKATARKDSTVIWGLNYSPSAKTVYGVSANEGKLFSYVKGKGFKDYGTVLSGKKDGRSVAYDAKTNQVFAGLGSPAELVAVDLKTNKKTPMLPSTYRSQKMVDSVQVIDSYVFVKMNPGEKILYFDAKSRKFLGELSATSKGVSPKAPNSNSVFYGNKTDLMEFDLGTKKTSKAVGGKVQTSILSFNFLKIGGEKTTKLVAKVGNAQRYLTFDLENAEYHNLDLVLPPQPIEMHKIGAGFDGLIYSSSFLNGSMAAYDPAVNKTSPKDILGQMESMASVNNKIYFGVYPQSRIMEYDPKQPWEKNVNPSQVASFNAYGQDRPMAALAVPGTSQLVFGTAPVSGKYGGALAVYDTKNGSSYARHQIVKDHSVVSLAYQPKQKLVYAGTSIFGKPNVDKTKTKAVLFTLPANNLKAKPTVLALPYKNLRFISALAVAGDGKVWGIADGQVFAYQPGKGVVTTKAVVPDVTGHTPNASLAVGKDGNLYGSVERNLFKVDAKSYKVTILRKNDVHQLVKDPKGNLYFHNKLELWKVNY